MRKLLMTSALVVPLLAMPAFAQEAEVPLPEGQEAEQAEQGAEVEVTTEEPEVEVIQEGEPQVEIVEEGEEAEAPEMAEEPLAEEPEMAEEPLAEEPEMAEEPLAEEPEMAEEPAAGPPPEAVVTEMGADEMRGDWVIGTDVVSPEGETIGDIKDLIITPDGQVSAAVLAVGGFLGMGAKNIAVDWAELQIAQDGREITLDLTREQAEEAPEYAYREQVEPPAAEVGAEPPMPEGEAAPGTNPLAPAGDPNDPAAAPVEPEPEPAN